MKYELLRSPSLIKRGNGGVKKGVEYYGLWVVDGEIYHSYDGCLCAAYFAVALVAFKQH